MSFFFGGLIGFERERKGRSAGLRTHILVCMGSCLIMLLSLFIFESYKNDVPLDPVRIAAGVVTGIGFLGAGTIMRSERVSGMTTAASIWVSAGIGLSAGCGFYFAAFIATLLSLVTLIFLKKLDSGFEEKATGRR